MKTGFDPGILTKLEEAADSDVGALIDVIRDSLKGGQLAISAERMGLVPPDETEGLLPAPATAQSAFNIAVVGLFHSVQQHLKALDGSYAMLNARTRLNLARQRMDALAAMDLRRTDSASRKAENNADSLQAFRLLQPPLAREGSRLSRLVRASSAMPPALSTRSARSLPILRQQQM